MILPGLSAKTKKDDALRPAQSSSSPVLRVSFQDTQPAHPLLESLPSMHGKFLTLVALPRVILHPMQQPTETRAPGDRSTSQGWESAPSTASPSFAGMLAALATPAQTTGAPGEESTSTKWRPAPSWNEDDLADDVATLSYESALKAHARYRSSQDRK